MRIENFIAAKKLVFVKTITIMDDQSLVKNVFIARCNEFVDDIDNGLTNTCRYDSPIFNMLKMAICFNILNEVMRMVNGLVVYSKKQWSDLVWRKAWALEDDDWAFRSSFQKFTCRIDRTVGGVNYLIWWQISDQYPKLLKVCDLCDMYQMEDASHLILHCSFHEAARKTMMESIETLWPSTFREDPDILNVLLGKNIGTINFYLMIEIWICAGKAISSMYYKVLKNRTGVG